jgi:hypothetical protein
LEGDGSKDFSFSFLSMDLGAIDKGVKEQVKLLVQANSSKQNSTILPRASCARLQTSN